jgi:ferritin
MALSESTQKALNGQIKREYFAHFVYRAIALDLLHKGYEGFAAWMKHHSQEEYGHAEKIISYLNEQDAKVVIPALDAPPAKWAGVPAALDEALAHEKGVTKAVYELVKLAEGEGDLATISFLDYFVSEQVEEEHTIARLIKRLSLGGGSDIGLMVMDGELMRMAQAH